MVARQGGGWRREGSYKGFCEEGEGDRLWVCVGRCVLSPCKMHRLLSCPSPLQESSLAVLCVSHTLAPLLSSHQSYTPPIAPFLPIPSPHPPLSNPSCAPQAISQRNIFSHHQKTVILDAPMDTPAGAAAAAESAPGSVTAAADAATLDNLGTPEGSPKHAGKHHHRHRWEPPAQA